MVGSNIVRKHPQWPHRVFLNFQTGASVRVYIYDASMRAVVQRVSRAEVRIDGQISGQINQGFVVLLGVAAGDTEADAAHLVDRILGMRIFADTAGKMNLSLSQV